MLALQPALHQPSVALAGAWSLAGPVAYVASRRGGRVADAGLVAYGLVEVLGAAFTDALPNALAVQGVVAASRVYSATRAPEE